MGRRVVYPSRLVVESDKWYRLPAMTLDPANSLQVVEQ